MFERPRWIIERNGVLQLYTHPVDGRIGLFMSNSEEGAKAFLKTHSEFEGCEIVEVNGNFSEGLQHAAAAIGSKGTWFTEDGVELHWFENRF